MTNVREHNRDAWNHQVRAGNRWTIPVTPQKVAAARRGELKILLTPTIPVPHSWFPDLANADVLCLASGGGQQGPLLAAAGANVTVFDNSPAQLAQDREVAEREDLTLQTVEGDMRDLSAFPEQSFDLIIHPVSNVFVPEVRPVWNEAFRVLRPGASLLSGFDNPVLYLFDEAAYDRGELQVKNVLPYSDSAALSADEIAKRQQQGRPLEFSHTLDDQIGGQLDAGFVIAGFYEDRYAEADGDLLGKYTALFMATRAVKQRSAEQ